MHRPAWFDDIADGRSVLQIALDVVTTYRGSYDRSPAKQIDDLKALEFVWDNWQEDSSKDDISQKFDNLVAEIIEVALDTKKCFMHKVDIASKEDKAIRDEI